MKFTAGYILGASTVVGMAASFVAGAYCYVRLVDSIDAVKNEAADKVKDVSVDEVIRSTVFRFGKKK